MQGFGPVGMTESLKPAAGQDVRIIPVRTPESRQFVADVERAMAITAALNRLTYADADKVQVAGRDTHHEVLLGDDPEYEVLTVFPLDGPHLDVLDDGGPVVRVDNRFADGESHM